MMKYSCPHLILLVGGSDNTQFMMDSSGSMVISWPKHSAYMKTQWQATCCFSKGQ